MRIITDNLESDSIKELIGEHLKQMRENSPEESVHALDIANLRRDNITFWSMWEGEKLAGCGALKELDKFHGEIKSMRTHKEFLRKGVAEKMLEHIVAEARSRGYRRLSLETGSAEYFKPAHELYKKFGFVECDPFVTYTEDPNSKFMTMEL